MYLGIFQSPSGRNKSREMSFSFGKFHILGALTQYLVNKKPTVSAVNDDGGRISSRPSLRGLYLYRSF